jgi:hypothetical protein
MLSRGVALGRPILGFLALFSGIALLLNILLNVDLRLGLGVLAAIMIGALILVTRGVGVEERQRNSRTIGYGLVAGILATLAYDLARTLLAEIDPSLYRPFEAITRFGQLLLGSEARDAGVVLAGGLYHVLNGTTFGVAWMFLFARDGRISVTRAVLLGSGWGLFLEMFQLVLYPDWLGIRYFSEFVSISASGHVVYGVTLGLVGPALLRRAARADRDRHTGRAEDG